MTAIMLAKQSLSFADASRFRSDENGRKVLNTDELTGHFYTVIFALCNILIIV